MQKEQQKNTVQPTLVVSDAEKKNQRSFVVDKNMVKDFLTYSFGAMLLKSSHYLLLPIITMRLSISDFGMLSLLNNFITIGTIAFGFGLRQVVSIEFFHQDTYGKKRLINEVVVLYCALSIPLITLFFIALPVIKQFFFTMHTPTHALVVALLTCFISFFNELFMQVMRYTSQSWLLTKIQLAGAFFSSVLKLIFMYYFSWAVTGLLGANFLGLVLIAVCGLYLYRKKVGVYSTAILSKKKDVLQYLKHGLPFVPSVLFSWILSSSDRWILVRYADLHVVGLYSYADIFSQLFQLFVLYPFIGAYFPYIIKQFIAHKDAQFSIEYKNRKMMWVTMGVCSALVVCAYGIGKPLLLFMTPTKYHPSLVYILPLLMGQIAFLGTHFVTCYMQYKKKIYYIVGLISVPAISNIFLNMILVPRFAIVGCVTATLISYSLYFGLTYALNRRLVNAELNNIILEAQ